MQEKLKEQVCLTEINFPTTLGPLRNTPVCLQETVVGFIYLDELILDRMLAFCDKAVKIELRGAISGESVLPLEIRLIPIEDEELSNA